MFSIGKKDLAKINSQGLWRKIRYISNSIAVQISPATTPTVYKTARIARFLFMLSLSLNKRASPTPALAQSPASSPPKLKLPETKVSVRITDDAQFGISPIKAATKG